MNKEIKTKKPKKITVKFFLNKALQPIEKDGDLCYPLYMLITYDRRSTMIKSNYGGYYKDLEHVEKVHYPGLLEFEERVITKTIQYELANNPDGFDLKGIHKKYDRYCVGLDKLMDSYLKQVLWQAVVRCEPQKYLKVLNFESEETDFEVLYEVVSKLYDETELKKVLPVGFNDEVMIYNTYLEVFRALIFQYKFPTVIEWLDGSVYDECFGKFKGVFLSNQQSFEKVTYFLNMIVRNTISTGK